jgi:hypothetical protein
MARQFDENSLSARIVRSAAASAASQTPEQQQRQNDRMMDVGLAIFPLGFIRSYWRSERSSIAKAVGASWTVIWVGAIGLLVADYYNPANVAGRAAVAQQEAIEEQASNLATGAQLACKRAIEGLAKWDYDWVGPLGLPNFYAPSDSGTTLLIEGDSLKLQNGFGAWQRHSFQCTYDKISRTITDARVL